MKLDDILNDWDADTKIDRTELGDAALDIPKLHAKWLRVHAVERLKLRKIEGELKQLRLEKHEFYTQGETTESRARGWVFPSRGTILVKDLPLYLDADPQIIEMNLKVAYQAEIFATLEIILKAISSRNWEIRAAIDWFKFTAGG